MTNQEMKAGRWLKLHIARKRLAWIAARLGEGRTVALTTYTRQTRYKAKHLDMFKATKHGLYVQRGKNWDCVDHCAFSAF